MSELALIIEDDEDLASIFAEALRGIGYEVDLVADGRVAQERLKTGPAPFLILLDMHLPHVSGAELLTNLIKQDERFAKTMVIITTADARMGDTYGDQVDFVLIKPISFVQLRDLTARLKPTE
ncbi:MAG TPA: response regulator [Anaerolineales bacterium]|jgi:CheY-like chemotaxis protein|nr:response regulator [Anaerolineales bacterium]